MREDIQKMLNISSDDELLDFYNNFDFYIDAANYAIAKQMEGSSKKEQEAVSIFVIEQRMLFLTMLRHELIKRNLIRDDI